MVRRPAVHVVALVRALGVVVLEVAVEIHLHSLDRLVSRRPADDAEVFVEHRPVEAFDEAVAQGTPHTGGRVFDLLELQEEFVGMRVLSAAELPPIVRQDGRDRKAVNVEEREHGVVQGVRPR